MTRTLAQSLSWLAILGTVLPPVLYLGGWIGLEPCQSAMLAATIVWFVVTPFWMERPSEGSGGSAALPT